LCVVFERQGWTVSCWGVGCFVVEVESGRGGVWCRGVVWCEWWGAPVGWCVLLVLFLSVCTRDWVLGGVFS